MGYRSGISYGVPDRFVPPMLCATFHEAAASQAASTFELRRARHRRGDVSETTPPPDTRCSRKLFLLRS
eukprot:2471682-Rhodomonas_salina.2